VDADRIRAFDDATPTPGETATATFALGCFWGPDAAFGAREGVVRTRVGYAGGTTADPTYHDIGDHSEAVQVDYEPDVCSFADLVELALDQGGIRHQPTKRQYHNVFFYESDEEREAIERAFAERAVDVAARVEPLESFTLAETYHQKYNLRSKRAVLSAFEDAGYDDSDIRESPAAAKLNAHVSGKRVPEIAAIQ
jgi:peptide-methionine (S)-S-oxide reductase